MAHQLRREGRLLAPAVKGYTLIFEEKNSDADEIAYARAVGEHVGEEICEVPPFFPDLSWFESRGRADRDMAPYPNGAMGINLGKTSVTDGSRVMLNGCGGDEWLEGSPLYYAEQLAAQNWPELYRNFRDDVADAGLRLSAWWIFRFGFAQFLPQSLLDLRRRLLTLLRLGNSDGAYWLSPELKGLLERRRGDIDRNVQLSIPFMARRNLFCSLSDSYAGIGRDHGARLYARSGYDSRSPMYARRFVDFAFATPERLRNRGGTGKYIHRKALSGLIPDVVANRTTKAEFTLAFRRQLDGMGYLLAYALPQNGSGCLDRNGVAKLYDRYRTNSFAGNPVWQLWGIFGCENALTSENKSLLGVSNQEILK